MKYTKYSCVKMDCPTEKSLAVGHISGFQIDPKEIETTCFHFFDNFRLASGCKVRNIENVGSFSLKDGFGFPERADSFKTISFWIGLSLFGEEGVKFEFGTSCAAASGLEAKVRADGSMFTIAWIVKGGEYRIALIQAADNALERLETTAEVRGTLNFTLCDRKNLQSSSAAVSRNTAKRKTPLLHNKFHKNQKNYLLKVSDSYDIIIFAEKRKKKWRHYEEDF